MDNVNFFLNLLRCQVSDETDVAGKLEDLILLMDRAESVTSPTGPPGSSTAPNKSGVTRSSSKDLSGTLKNLRRLDQVMTCKNTIRIFPSSYLESKSSCFANLVVDEVLSMDPTADEDYERHFESLTSDGSGDVDGECYDRSLQSPFNGYHGGYLP